MKKIVLPVLACLILSPICGGVLRIMALDCTSHDQTFIIFEHCTLKPISRGVKEISISIKLLQIPITNVTVHFELRQRGIGNQLLYQFDVDGCRFMGAKRRNPIANAVYKSMRLSTVSNLNHSCPYDHDIIIDHFRVDENLSMYLPVLPGEYYFKLFWSFFNVLRSTVIVNIQQM